MKFLTLTFFWDSDSFGALNTVSILYLVIEVPFISLKNCSSILFNTSIQFNPIQSNPIQSNPFHSKLVILTAKFEINGCFLSFQFCGSPSPSPESARGLLRFQLLFPKFQLFQIILCPTSWFILKQLYNSLSSMASSR